MRGTAFTRVDWTQGLDISTVADTKDAEVLLWVGCGGALVERNQKTVRALAQLLKKAGVKFAVLGREEKCTGDPGPAHRQRVPVRTLAQENIATLDKHQVKTIVTSCPHCFNTFRNEYPQLGGSYEVFHHSQYLAKLVDEGKLTGDMPTDRKSRSTILATWAGTTACSTRRGNWCRSPRPTRRSRCSRAARMVSVAAAGAA